MNFDPKLSLGNLVAENYRLAAVLSSYGLDFCCHGNRTLKEASEIKRDRVRGSAKIYKQLPTRGKGSP